MTPPRPQPQSVAEYLTPDQVATILGVSRFTVVRQFEARDGVIDLGSPETLHKRRKRNLRISRRALDELIAERQVRVRQRRK